MTDPADICDQKQDAYAAMGDGPEDMPLIDELALACEAADGWFRKHHDAFRPLPNHFVVWLQLRKAVTRYNVKPDPPLEIDDCASWHDDPGLW